MKIHLHMYTMKSFKQTQNEEHSLNFLSTRCIYICKHMPLVFGARYNYIYAACTSPVPPCLSSHPLPSSEFFLSFRQTLATSTHLFPSSPVPPCLSSPTSFLKFSLDSSYLYSFVSILAPTWLHKIRQLFAPPPQQNIHTIQRTLH